MKSIKTWGLTVCLTLLVISTRAALMVQVGPPKNTSSMAIIKLDLQNTFAVKVDSVRAAMFLVDQQGKVVGQATHWIIGGGKDKPPLAPGAKTRYYLEPVAVLTF